MVHSGFLGTLIWALFDAGWDFWPLVSRLMVPTGFMLFGFATWPAASARRQEQLQQTVLCPRGRISRRHAGRLRTNVPAAPDRRLQGEELPLLPVEPNKAQKNWENYGNTPAVTASSHSIRLTVTTSKT